MCIFTLTTAANNVVSRETLWNQLPMSPEMITVAETMVDGRSPTQLQIAVPKALHYRNYSGDMLIREPIGRLHFKDVQLQHIDI